MLFNSVSSLYLLTVKHPLYLLHLCLYSFSEILSHLYSNYAEFFFQADCLSLLHLVVLLGFYLETYFSAVSVLSEFPHLLFSLLRLQVCSYFASAVYPLVVEDGSGICAGFLVVGTNSSPLVGRAGSYPSIQFSRSVTSDSLQPHELQHTRPLCPSSTP